MGNLFLMTTIVDRKDAERYIEVFKENDMNVLYLTLGFGTATSEVLDYLGMDSREKAVAFLVVEEDGWFDIKKQLEKKLKIDAPGGGISFITPLSSIGSRKALQYLIESDSYEKKEESELKNTAHELIVVISEQGYTEMIMEAARAAGAYGGTVIHAKGTGQAAAEKFLGVTIAVEKEILYIVTKTEQKNAIMKAIMKDAGIDSIRCL